jgi:hypothetical protein
MRGVKTNVRFGPKADMRLFRFILESQDGRAVTPISEEKHEPVTDIDTGVVDSLKALDPKSRLEKRTLDRLLNHLVGAVEESRGNIEL